MAHPLKVIGVETQKGTYEGNDYHNVKFHCTEPIAADKGAGLSAKSVKVKYSVIAEIVGKPPTDKELQALVGKDVEFFYNEYKAVTFIRGITTTPQ